MSEDTNDTVVENTEADQAEGESTENDTDGQQSEDSDGQQAEKVKTFTQDELDAILIKERARAERKARQKLEREYQRQPVETKAPPASQPKRSDYATDDEWIDAKFDYKEQLKEVERSKDKASKAQAEFDDLIESRFEEAEKIPEFDRDLFQTLVGNHGLSDMWAEALLESDDCPKIMAYLSANPKEFKRISDLSPNRQAADIGRLEAQLEKKTKPATEQITKVKGGSVNNSPLMKMTPSQIAAMPMKEFEKRMKAERART